jgi:queuine tRNA-ribosyltransferase
VEQFVSVLGGDPGQRRPMKSIRAMVRSAATMPQPLSYELIAADPASGGRVGRVTTPHGTFDTPAFMPVGTQGTVKGLLPDLVAGTGSQCVLANTYHLMLRPGEATVAALGDLHRFMAWPGPILTDSGGFQVFSLADLNKITDEGVTFKSHVDGAVHHLTPERSMAVQNALGADIIMMFDECPAAEAPLAYHADAVGRTLRWAKRCAAAHGRSGDQALFGIVQGGVDLTLRSQCAAELVAMGLPGYAVGGLAVGEGFEAMGTVLDHTCPLLPADRPRYLMGVGFPRDIVPRVAAGRGRGWGSLSKNRSFSICRATPHPRPLPGPRPNGGGGGGGASTCSTA